jgi:hypothetical protein
MSRIQGHSSAWRSKSINTVVTPSGIEPTTIRLAVQSLNQMHQRVFNFVHIITLIVDTLNAPCRMFIYVLRKENCMAPRIRNSIVGQPRKVKREDTVSTKHPFRTFELSCYHVWYTLYRRWLWYEGGALDHMFAILNRPTWTHTTLNLLLQLV